MGQGSVSKLGHYWCCYAQPVPGFEQLLVTKRSHPVTTSGFLWGGVLVQTALSPTGTFGPIWSVEVHHSAWLQTHIQSLHTTFGHHIESPKDCEICHKSQAGSDGVMFPSPLLKTRLPPPVSSIPAWPQALLLQSCTLPHLWEGAGHALPL